MRVLQVVKGLDLGGAERVVTDLAVHLAARGPEVEVAVINGRRRALLPVLQQAGIAVHALPGTDLVGPRGVLALRRLIRSGNYDLVHAHGPVPLVLCRPFSPVPVVGTMHSVWGGLRRPSRWAAALLCGRVPLVAVAEAVRSTLPQRLARNTTVIPHGVDLDAVAAACALARHDESDQVRMLTVASHRHQKNYPNLLAAVAHARAAGAQVHLQAIGEGPRLQAHRHLAAQLGLADHVTFTTPHLDVLADIAACDIFVLASDYEGQPIVIVEALACGRPVIATAVGRTPELVTPDVGILVPIGNPAALGAAIAELASDPGRRVAMGEAALGKRHEYSFERAVDAHLALYTEMCAGGPGRVA